MQVKAPDPSDAPAGPLWWGTAAAVAVLCVLSTLAPGSGAHAVLYPVGVMVLSASFAVVVRRRRLEPADAWTVFAVGLVLLAVGDLVYGLPWDTQLAGSGLSWADPFYLLGSLVLVVGALRLKRAHAGERNREALVDAASIGLAAAVLLWRPLIEPRLNVADSSVLARTVNASYPVLDVVVLAMMLWLLLGSRRWTPATLLLVGASVSYLVADLAYTVRIDQGLIDDATLDWLDAFWLIAYGLYLLAAMHPSARAIGERQAPSDQPISLVRLAVSGVVLLSPMVALALSDRDLPHLVFVAAVEAVLVVLVLVRLADLASGERRARRAVVDRERYFRSLVQHSSEAMLVLDADGIATDASPAVRTLLGVEPEDLIGHRASEVIVGVDRSAIETLWREATATPEVVVTAEVSVADPAGLRWLEMRITNLIADPAVAGLVVNVHDVTARHLIQTDLEHRAFTDSLTGLPNRALFHDRLDQLLARREREELAVVYCDLDRFKDVNDRFGHAEGDRLLEITAARLAAAVRAEDTVARLGGDEFAVLVHGPDALEVAQEVAARIVEELGRPLAVGSEAVPVAVSVGVAFAPAGTAGGARALMHSADEAMYRAKRSGGDRVVVLAARPGVGGPSDRGPAPAGRV